MKVRQFGLLTKVRVNLHKTNEFHKNYEASTLALARTPSEPPRSRKDSMEYFLIFYNIFRPCGENIKKAKEKNIIEANKSFLNKILNI